MALIDQQNKVIYWDEVNWQWLPFLAKERNGKFYLIKDKKRFPVNCQEDVVSLIKSFGFCLSSIQDLGITEVSAGYFLYKGKLYSTGTPKTGIIKLISIISGNSLSKIHNEIKGHGVLSKNIFEELLSRDTVEYKGKVYKSLRNLAENLNVPYSYMRNHLSKGRTIDEIIKMYVPRDISDHLGNKFDSVSSMIEYWGISRNAYLGRRAKGLPLEEILTKPVKSLKRLKEYKDFEGNVFSTKAEMAEHWGVNYSTLRNRLRLGWSLEEALTGNKKRGN